MDAEEKPTFSSRQSLVRDRFIFIALRELGLRASELTGATMSSFYRVSDPKDGGTYSAALDLIRATNNIVPALLAAE